MYNSAPKFIIGFTLIEMVVVVGIMGILTVTGVASYGTFNNRAKVEQAAVSVSTQLRTWQKQVNSGIGSSSCAGAVFGGISVSRADEHTISATVLCGGISTGDPQVLIIPNECIVNAFSTFTLKSLGGTLPATNITIVHPTNNLIAYLVSLSLSGGIDVKKS